MENMGGKRKQVNSDDIEYEDSGSISKTQPKKKRRVSIIEEDDSEIDSQILSDSADVDIDVNSSFSNSQFSQSQIERESPHLNIRSSSSGKRIPSNECGTIEQVQLQNFMCHSNLLVSLGPKVNFVVGENGSGKSAMLVGLAIALGASTKFARGNSKISELVKHGCVAATVSVKLRNSGEEGYVMPDGRPLGESIYIERRLARNGGSSYKVKDHRKKIVSNKKNDVKLILEHFNIQVNNPCAILMQDTSREFLVNSKPRDKYRFFLQATQLGQMKSDFEKCKEYLESMKDRLKRHNKMMPDLEKNYKDLEREYQQFKNLRELQDHSDVLRDQFAWAHVVEDERLVEEAKQAFLDGSKQIERLQKKIGEIEEKRKEIEAVLDEKKGSLQELTSKAEGFRKDIDTQKRNHTGLEQKRRRALSEIQGFESRVSQLKRRIRTAKKQKVSTQKANQVSEEEDPTERLEQVRERVKSIEEEILHLKKKKDAEEEALDQKREQQDEVKRELSKVQTEQQKVQGNLRRLKESQKDPKKLYGELIDFRRKLQQAARQFKKPPIGPIGVDVKLKEQHQDWALPLEKALGSGLLKAFVVDNHDDLAKIRQMARSLKTIPQFIVTKFTGRRYQIPNINPGKYLLALNTVDIENTEVFNAVIDQTSLERVVFIPNDNECQDVMAARSLDPRITTAFSKSGLRALIVSDMVKTTGCKDKNSNFIGVNAQAAIAQQSNRDRELSSQMSTVNSRLREVQSSGQAAKTSLAKTMKQLTIIEKEHSFLLHDIKDLQAAIQIAKTESQKDELDLSEYDKAIDGLSEDLKTVENNIEDHKRTIIQIEKELSPHNSRVAELKEQLEQVEGELDSANDSISVVTNQIVSTESNYSSKQGRLEDIQAKQKDNEQHIKNCQDQLETTIEKVTKYTSGKPRMQVTKTKEQLDQELAVLTTRIEKEKRGRRDPLEVSRAYKSSKKRYEHCVKTLADLGSLKERLSITIEKRIRIWEKFRHNIGRRTMKLFHLYLSKKGFSGEINFDHKQETLDVTVHPDQRSHHNVKQNTRNLSGGEKSYSTVALLLSLWEAMECPFRAMDEFDVYMDNINRKISIRLLVDSATEKKNRQFIFITPHNFSDIGGPDVRVTRMRPPERSQRTLDFSGNIE